ncbi:MAG: nicotinate-nucleotide adenylyltransferase [Burkholderiaceae bacterium]|nr:nicotinate-nucleotide adenylyltransferase [Burkholderiaceae bacterium]
MTRSPPGRPKANTPPRGGGAIGVSGAVRRIGLLGGTFDPVHNAHVALACVALDTLALDQLRWVPAGEPWQKTRRITSGADRIAMLDLAIAGEPRFVLERCEIDRMGPSYTFDTVRNLQQREPNAQWFLIVGRDQFANLHTWHRWKELLSLVTLAVAARPGAAQPADAQVQGRAYQVLPLPTMEVSASTIRERLSRGEGIDNLVPPGVARYIGQHALYLPERAPHGS